MNRIESFEELQSLEITGVQKTLKECPNFVRLLKEAFENPNCMIFERHGTLDIIVYVPSIASTNTKRRLEPYGLYIPVYSYAREIDVWMAEKDGGEFTDAYAAGHYDSTTSLDEVISLATNKLNQCDYCKENVGLENLTRIAFCNKACPKCEKSAREKDEFPGWAN